MVQIKEPVKTTPKDVFLHLLMMVMLYISVISLIALSFAYIDYMYPDQLSYYAEGTLSTIRSSSSMIIIAFPLLLLLSWFIQRIFRKEPKKHELKFSKWLVYLTLFVAAITIVIDLIQLVNRFYSGELTLPFGLKVLSVLVLTGAVFGYYIWDVQNEAQKSKVPSVVGWLSTLLVIGMLVLGLFLVGTPMKQRQIRMDEQRISDLQMIQGELINYWQNKEKLPVTLDDLKNDISGFRPPLDPENSSAYEYTILEPLKFRLCATFNQPNPYRPSETGTTRAIIPTTPYKDPYYSSMNQIWDHEAGHQCFERTIDPALYPKSTQYIQIVK